MNRRRVALDANLLVLLVVGSLNPRFVAQHKRLTDFDVDDYFLLVAHIGDAEPVTTPNAMTEASNLVAQGFVDPARSGLLNSLKRFAELASETYVPSRKAASESEYRWLGLTDAAWLGSLDQKTELLTVDLDLFLAAQRRGLPALNFNHLRDRDDL